MNSFSKTKDLIINHNNSKTEIIKRLLQFVLGCLMISLSYNIFIAPNNLVPGGVGGIAVIIKSLLGIDNSITIIVLNIFLLILSYILLGKEKTRYTILGTLIFPILIKITEHINVWLQIDPSNLLLSTIIGGITYGFGAGLIFKAGFTTGGTDIINQIISKFAKLSMGTSMLMSDGLIVLSTGVFFGLYSMMYSIILLYIISIISDRVVLGISSNKMFYIITEKDEEIKEFIINKLKHGVTIFKGRGGYRKKNGNVLMTVLPTKDYYELKTGINKIDKKAFFIVTDSYEVFGGE